MTVGAVHPHKAHDLRVEERPKVGDRHVVIRVAGTEIGFDYAGPYFVEKWDGTQWREIGRPATKDDLRAMGCVPPDLEGIPRYANRRTRTQRHVPPPRSAE